VGGVAEKWEVEQRSGRWSRSSRWNRSRRWSRGAEEWEVEQRAIVRENEATAQMVKIKHELENMAREEKELEVMYLEEVKEMEPERRKEIYLEEVKEMDEGPWVWRHV